MKFTVEMYFIAGKWIQVDKLEGVPCSTRFAIQGMDNPCSNSFDLMSSDSSAWVLSEITDRYSLRNLSALTDESPRTVYSFDAVIENGYVLLKGLDSQTTELQRQMTPDTYDPSPHLLQAGELLINLDELKRFMANHKLCGVAPEKVSTENLPTNILQQDLALLPGFVFKREAFQGLRIYCGLFPTLAVITTIHYYETSDQGRAEKVLLSLIDSGLVPAAYQEALLKELREVFEQQG